MRDLTGANTSVCPGRSSVAVDPQTCSMRSVLPSPLWGGAGGGGPEVEAPSMSNSRPPTLTLPHRKSGLPDLRINAQPGQAPVA